MHPSRRPVPSSLIASLAALVTALLLAGAPAPAGAATALYTNPTPIVIPDRGQASPYPSQIEVQGLAGRITGVNVTLRQFAHARAFDVDVLLVSPDGEASIVMSNTCRNDANATWTFHQDAPFPIAAPCDQFIYRPLDDDTPGYDTGDSWPGAPPGDHVANLDRFIGNSPNGTWRLYVVDDRPFDPPASRGRINGGWMLTIETAVPDAVVPGTGSVGTANPYPAARTVSGVNGVIKDVDVVLNGVFHGKPDDLDLVLVGPRGQKVMLMSDACGTSAVKRANWGWDDEAAAAMADAGPCPTNADYRPTNHEVGEGLPTPAPAGPYGGSLSAFDFTDPNGEWRLYVDDDRADGSGFFVNRFDLQIETRPKASIAFTGGAVELGEGEAGELTLRRDSGGQGFGEGTVTVTTTPLSAGSAGDFEPVSATIELARGQQDATIPVRTLADALSEGAETFAVTAAQPSGDVDLASPSTTLVTIRDDDAGPGGGGGPGSGPESDRSAPETTIEKAPKRRTERRTARFRFAASEPGARFECKLDRRRFKPCASPRRLKRLRAARHRFAVRAIDVAGNVDPTPAVRRWRVLK